MSAPELLAKEMPLVRMIERNLLVYGYEKETLLYADAFTVEIEYYRKFGWSVSSQRD